MASLRSGSTGTLIGLSPETSSLAPSTLNVSTRCLLLCLWYHVWPSSMRIKCKSRIRDVVTPLKTNRKRLYFRRTLCYRIYARKKPKSWHRRVTWVSPFPSDCLTSYSRPFWSTMDGKASHNLILRCNITFERSSYRSTKMTIQIWNCSHLIFRRSNQSLSKPCQKNLGESRGQLKAK